MYRVCDGFHIPYWCLKTVGKCFNVWKYFNFHQMLIATQSSGKFETKQEDAFYLVNSWGQKRHCHNVHWYCRNLQIACICFLDKVHVAEMKLKQGLANIFYGRPHW